MAGRRERHADRIHHGVRSGRAIERPGLARVRGRTGGRPRATTRQKPKAGMTLMADRGNAARDVAQRLGVPLSTLHACIDAGGHLREHARRLLGPR